MGLRPSDNRLEFRKPEKIESRAKPSLADLVETGQSMMPSGTAVSVMNAFSLKEIRRSLVRRFGAEKGISAAHLDMPNRPPAAKAVTQDFPLRLGQMYQDRIPLIAELE